MTYRQKYWLEHPEYRLRQLIYQRERRRNNPGRRKSDYASHKEYFKKWPERRVWDNMNSRCNNPKASGYKHYGGRGIKVIYKSFDQFIDDVGRRPNKELQIDRINNARHYEIGNCRWTTRSEQNKNRRNWRLNDNYNSLSR